MMIGVTVTEWKRRERESGKLQTHWVHWVRLELTYPNSPSAFYFLRASSTLAMSLWSIFLIYIHCCKLPSLLTTIFSFLSAFLTSTLAPLLPSPLVFWIWADLDFPPPPQSPSQLWITCWPETQRLPGPPDDSQPGYNKWLTALFT